MNVLILSTYEKTGGAAIAANRLLHALRNNGVQVNMLSRQDIPWWPAKLKPQSYTSLWERLVVWLHNGLSMKNLWAVDIANSGQDITQTKAFREADVVHLHWINQGFISLQTISTILSSGKRVVWTMHDEWPLSGIEHYTTDTTLPSSLKKLDRQVQERKREVYSKGHITFVTCSKWLGDIARQKPLGTTQEILSVPNPIDTALFQPLQDAGKEFGFDSSLPVILFACQKVTDKRKGLDYLIEATRQLKDVSIALVGANTDAVAELLPKHIRAYSLGTIRDTARMARLYAACQCFVTPSLQDNLPNTIMESMSCCTPCVGFNVGGIPEMIDHQVNGYVAEYRNANDLAQGIRYVLDKENNQRLALAARQKVEQCYSERAVAQQYIKIYNQ